MKTRRSFTITFIVFLGILYVSSFWLITVGFLTPGWIYNFDSTTPCYNVGLVTGGCNYRFSDFPGRTGTSLRVSFFLELAGFVLFQLGVLLVLAGFLLHLFSSTLYLSALGVAFGVLLPAAGLLIVAGCTLTYVETAWRGWAVGYSCVLSTVAGVGMLTVYLLLRLYEMSLAGRRQKKKSSSSRKDRKPTTRVKALWAFLFAENQGAPSERSPKDTELPRARAPEPQLKGNPLHPKFKPLDTQINK